MSALSEFLLARYSEDEVVARQAAGDGDGKWATGSHPMDECRIEGDGMIIYDEGGHTQAQASHIARHDPARALADIEAKREVVAVHHGWDTASGHSPDYWSAPMDEVLYALALPYADHPDYRPEWRP